MFKKKYLFIVLFILILFTPFVVNARSGCCSWHGGVSHCGNSGYYICNDGTRSPSCTCSNGSSNSITYTTSSCDCSKYEEKISELEKTVESYKYRVDELEEMEMNYDVLKVKSDRLQSEGESKKNAIIILVIVIIIMVIYHYYVAYHNNDK